MQHESCVFQGCFVSKIDVMHKGTSMWKIMSRCNCTISQGAVDMSNSEDISTRAKHINLWYHFIWEHIANEDINLEYVNTENQLADIFTKPLKEDRFCSLRRELGVCAIECWLLWFFKRKVIIKEVFEKNTLLD